MDLRLAALVPLLVIALLAVPVAKKEIVECDPECESQLGFKYDLFGVREYSWNQGLRTYDYEDHAYLNAHELGSWHLARIPLVLAALVASGSLAAYASNLQRGQSVVWNRRLIIASHAAMLLSAAAWLFAIWQHIWSLRSAVSGLPDLGLAILVASFAGLIAFAAKPTEVEAAMPSLPETSP